MEEHSDDFLNAVPVTDTQRKTTYKNIFCYFCNVENKTSTVPKTNFKQKEVSPWNLIVFCKDFINPDYFPSFHAFISILKQMNCRISLQLYNSATKCEVRNPNVKVCNTTGFWSKEDVDIKRACERIRQGRLPVIEGTGNDRKFYKNTFCQMCNPVFKETKDIITSCEKTKVNVQEYAEEACGKLPTVQMASNYKNIFCERCNGYALRNDKIGRFHPFPPRMGYHPNFFVPRMDFIPGSHGFYDTIAGRNRKMERMTYFRTIFALNVYTNNVPQEQYKSCPPDHQQTTLKNDCKNKTCYPGKILQNYSCVSLLKQIKNLRLVLYFWMHQTDNGSRPITLHAWRILQLLQFTIYQKIKSITNSTSSVELEETILLSNKPCQQRDITGLKVYAQLVIFINGYVNRLEIEQNLLNFSNSLQYFVFDSLTYEFKLSQVLFTPVFPFFLQKCLLTDDMRHGKNSRNLQNSWSVGSSWLTKTSMDGGNRTLASSVYRKTYVNKLLLCQQVFLYPSEYVYNSATETLKIREMDLTLPKDKFLLDADNSVRVCADELTKTFKTKRSIENNSNLLLPWITFICILISLICLSVTLIIYCLFSTLRTLPGLNNMCLIISLFFAQTMTIARPYALAIHSVAIVPSITLHFSWLSVFFWLQICSFHMFRVFTSKTHIIKSERENTCIFIKYACYAYCFSGLIVLSHIIVNLVISNGHRTGYENRNNLVNDRIAFIVTVISPMVLICFSNSIFFVVTVHHIHTTPHAQKNRKPAVDVWVYVKLFCLTGLSWIFQVVDSFLSLSFLSYVVAILNGLQGLFLFLSLVCNGRVLRLCCKQKAFDSSTHNSSSRFNSSKNSTKF
ncbi:uncharacterized protein LOC134257267 [Saccostrea cucullata]|uniref:uncharacterized protein LOC134257267 n=1 Tax=Saccostrea cuccullata TaxID=36930 RepID=UPI002ED64623